MSRWLLTLGIGLALAACEHKPKPLDPVPAELQPRVARANEAIGELKKTLSGRLSTTLREQGPKGGIEVCAGEAQKLTTEVGTKQGVRLGRTSTRLRNAERNGAPAWLQGYLERVSAQKAKDARPIVVDLGDHVGVAEPLPVLPLCVTCHGDPASLAPEVKSALAARYPADRATGYAEGDVRGVVWVEVSKK